MQEKQRQIVYKKPTTIAKDEGEKSILVATSKILNDVRENSS